MSYTWVQPHLLHVRTQKRSRVSWKTAGLFYPLLFSVRSWVTAIAYQRHTLAQTGSGFISPAALCSGALAAHLPVSPPSERSGAPCTRTWAAAGGTGDEISPGESYHATCPSQPRCLRSITVYRQPEGCRLVPNITNQGINPLNNLLMQLKHAAEHSDADCVRYSMWLRRLVCLLLPGHVNGGIIIRKLNVSKRASNMQTSNCFLAQRITL